MIYLFIVLPIFSNLLLVPNTPSSFDQLGLGGFLLRYIPGLFQSLLTEMGIDEDMYTPVCKF